MTLRHINYVIRLFLNCRFQAAGPEFQKLINSWIADPELHWSTSRFEVCMQSPDCLAYYYLCLITLAY